MPLSGFIFCLPPQWLRPLNVCNMRPNLIFESNTPLSPFLKLRERVGSLSGRVTGGVAGKSGFVPLHEGQKAGRLHVEAFLQETFALLLVLKFSI